MGRKDGYSLTFSAPMPEAFLKFLQGRFIFLEPAASLAFGNADFMTVLMSVVKLFLRGRVFWVVRKIFSCQKCTWRLFHIPFLHRLGSCSFFVIFKESITFPLASYLFRFLKRKGTCHKLFWDLLPEVGYKLKAH